MWLRTSAVDPDICVSPLEVIHGTVTSSFEHIFHLKMKIIGKQQQIFEILQVSLDGGWGFTDKAYSSSFIQHRASPCKE